MKLSVGIDQYPARSGYAPLRYARRDASLFSKALFVDHEPLDLWDQDTVERSQFLDAFSSFLDGSGPGTNFFYFAGHSFIGPSGTRLVFSDSRASVKLSTSVSVNYLLREAAKHQGHFIFIMDSCRNITDSHGYDFFSKNSCVLYSTASGKYRYEEFSISRSFPAVLERALRYQEQEFQLSDLCGAINSLRVNPSFDEQRQAEIASDTKISKEICKAKSSIFATSDLRSVELYTGVENSKSLDDFKKLHENEVSLLSDRYSGLLQYKELDPIKSSLFSLTLFAPQDFLPFFLRDVVRTADISFSGITVPLGFESNEAIADGVLEKLPNPNTSDEYYRWKDRHFLFRLREERTIIIPVKGNVEVGIDSASEIFSLLEVLYKT